MLKSFYGSSENAIYTQIWIAAYALMILVIAKSACVLKNLPAYDLSDYSYFVI